VSSDKPLGQKAYGSIGHLPGSRMGPADHKISDGQARIATVKTRDRHDRVFVEEKLDGSCVSVARVNGEIIPLGRAGHRAVTSPFRQHVLFDQWVRMPTQYERFDELLGEGERIVGEWLAQAHGTRYDLGHREPFVPFDIMTGIDRLPRAEFWERVTPLFSVPMLLNTGEPMSIEVAMARLVTYGFYGALDPVEGAVWRVERAIGGPSGKTVVDFLAKYVRPDKADGSYLDSVTGGEPVWNWQP
jgi:hypothetical protein